MSASRRDRRTLADAFEAGLLVGRLQYSAKRGKRHSPARPRTLMQWLRLNATPLTLLASILTSLSSGLWAVYTYYRPAPTAVVEPFDGPDRNRRAPAQSNDKANEPRERPEDPFKPKIELLIYGVPVANVPQPVQRSLQAAASIIEQTPEQQRQVEDSLLKLLASMGYIPSGVTNAIVWQGWNTIAVVPVAQNAINYPMAMRTLDPPPAPQTFEPSPSPSKPSGGEQS